MRRRLSIIRYCLYTFIAFSVSAFATNKVDDYDDSKVIATINGVPIYERDVTVPFEEVNQFILSQKMELLEHHARQIAEKLAIQEFGIVATESEISEKVGSSFEAAGINETKANEIATLYKTIIECLKRWQQDKSQSQEIYEDDLSGLITNEEWIAWQQSCPTPSDLIKLESQIPTGLSDMKQNSRLSAEKDILHEKLIAYITKDVKAREDEIIAAYEDRYKDEPKLPELSQVRDDLANMIIEEKKELGIKRFWMMRIQNLDMNFQDAQLKLLWDKKYGSNPAFTAPIDG